jgi:GMP synthase (glutamine-hydrolysing)
MPPVLVVQHEESVPPGHIEAALVAGGVEHVVMHAWREERWPQERWPDVSELAGLIVLGGTMNVDQLEAYPYIARSRALMAAALDRGVPTLGVCLGSQMMARVLGAEVYRAEPRNAYFSTIDATTEGAGDLLIKPFASGQPVLQFHEDTFALPPDAELLATSSASGLNQAFRYGDNAYAIQFHFEVDRDIVSGWAQDIGPEGMAGEWGITTEELLRQTDAHLSTQASGGRELMQSFLNLIPS